MEIYFPVKDYDSDYRKCYQLVNFQGKPISETYKGTFGFIPLARDVASKIKNKELGDYLIVDMSLGVFEENSALKRLKPLNSLEYEFFHMFLRIGLKEKEKK